MQHLKFATSNPNKLKEASEILGFSMEQIKLDLDEIQTTSVEELIRHKAIEAYKKSGKNVIVEDSGLEFISWNGLPGALIKWFESTVKIEGILKMLENFEERTALAVCYVAMYDGEEFFMAKGEVKGKISHKPTGDNGFGWDVIFIPDGYDKTFAELGSDIKNQISQRKLAFENFKKLLMK
ncbi:RdgB/HAM1 family non-canonical purine NTP pyrophosphatase [Candidatus Gracilibacteria bacterium]|nr:RdgB/HAM1 family non-canonical purine NTP pyrophosphatase [Candidatus Gracilibacteria bacterium]